MTLEEIADLEQQWIGRIPVTQPDVYFDWQPAPIPLFTGLLEACLPHIPGNRTFLDVGCGIGTKALIAASYGLAAAGFDRVPEYVAEARRLGVDAGEFLAEDFDGYGDYGLVYYNHPLACGPGCDDEAALEHGIHVQVASGSVLAGMNYDLAPGCRNPRHSGPPEPCDDDCTQGFTGSYDGWAEVARLGAWVAAWVKS